ncbi:MAG: IS1380 family transposase, partial [Verrucomicrobiae bacterium]|nr:IS1380 family transposase [Verrucomicrobiae bacterium]
MPKGTKKFAFSFEERHITHFGGMWLIQRFCSQLGLRRLLQRYVSIPQQNADYHPAELFLALLYCIIMGMRRINKTEILQYNGSFLEMLGLEKFPDQTTLRRFLRRLSPQSIRRLAALHDSLRHSLFSVPKPRHSLTFDIDSVVIVVYGNAEKAAVGYNPKKPGRRSHHPLFCFEAHLQEFWHGRLRPGNAGSSTGIISFLEVCLAKAPRKMGRSRIRFRMDSGFYSRHVVEFLDQRGCGYVIVAKEKTPLRMAMMNAKFHSMAHGWEAGEFFYQPQKWKRPHRFIVVRRPVPEDPQEANQLTLFKHRKYAYHVFVTNLKTTPWRTYLFYNIRAATEKNNRELLYDYPLGKIPTQSWT